MGAPGLFFDVAQLGILAPGNTPTAASPAVLYQVSGSNNPGSVDVWFQLHNSFNFPVDGTTLVRSYWVKVESNFSLSLVGPSAQPGKVFSVAPWWVVSLAPDTYVVPGPAGTTNFNVHFQGHFL